MHQPSTGDPSKVLGAAAPRRLDGWKDIAAYLCKAERTVKRWEVERGLPIHRLPGGARASVYAYQAELDAWLKSSNIPVPDSLDSGDQTFDQEDPVAPASTAPPTELLPDPHSTRANIAKRWLAPSYGLLLAALVVASGTFVLLAAAIPIKVRFPSIFGKVHTPAHLAPSAASEQEKIQARDLYLKGRYEWNQRTPESLNRALSFFNQSIADDPGYANAYAGLADTYDLLREYSTTSDMDVFPRALAAARKAVELDPSLADAHRSLAFAEMYGSWEFADAESEFRRAIELNPSDPQVRRWYANAFGVKGRFAEALEQMDKAQELDPSSHATLADKGYLLYNAGQTQQAIETLKEVERSAPDFRSPHVYLMQVSFNLRDYPTYLEEGEKSALASNDPVLREILASARAGYEREGANGLLKNLYARQKEYSQAGKLSAVILAKTCVAMGKRQEALALLEDAYARHDATVLACLSHPDLLTLQDEPRYKSLLKKINFPASVRD
jgi:tetratricopeptide (TPR) repeat protein